MVLKTVPDGVGREDGSGGPPSTAGKRSKRVKRQSEVGLSLAVQDNGMGIAKEHLGKVFERLYRVPTGNVHNVKGFGLGLSYVKNVIERHEGSVQIESTPGEGTTLTLNLPFEHQPDKTEET